MRSMTTTRAPGADLDRGVKVRPVAWLGLAVAAAVVGCDAMERGGSAAETPLVRFGLVADLHYAEIPPSPCIPPVGDRFYAESAGKLGEFVSVMNDVRPDFVIELGDFKDQGKDVAETLGFLRTIEGVFSGFRGPRYHVLGNHDCDRLTKDEFLSVCPNEGCRGSFYSFVRGGVTCIVLDACFKSDNSPYSRENPWTDSVIPPHEIDWLVRTLAAAKGPVVVFCHQRLDPEAEPQHLVKNADEVRAVLERSGKVKAVFTGHQHFGGSSDVNGIWYYTLRALGIFSGPEENAYAVASVFADGRVSVRGYRKASGGEYRATPADDGSLAARGIVVDGILQMNVERRVFADGVAVRYRLPEGGTRRISGEDTVWTLPVDAQAWYQPGRSRDGFWGISYEAEYASSRIGDLNPGDVVALPFVAKLSDGTYRFISEANVVDFTDSAARYLGDGRFVVFHYCEPQGFEQSGSSFSPWRLTLVAKDLQTLATSDLVRRLCPPPSASRAWHCKSFVKLGCCIWQWLPAGSPVLSEQKGWYDRTRELGFEYYLIDDGWKTWRDGEADQWACLRRCVDYGRSVGVGTFMWVDSKEMLDAASRRAYLEKVKATGAVGIKIDFIPVPTCARSKWYEETLAETCRLGLMVDFHGAVKPSGRERTWPHEVAREAIRGHEWHITRYRRVLRPEHDCILPFLRLVQGHADYTPVVLEEKELVGMSRVRELAQGVVFSAPFLCFGDYPENYLRSPAAAFLKSLRPVYDETRILSGSEIGACVALAKRRGDAWWVAVENGACDRKISLSFDFLGAGEWSLDGFASERGNPRAMRAVRLPVTSASSVPLELEPCGGFVARLTQRKESEDDR